MFHVYTPFSFFMSLFCTTLSTLFTCDFSYFYFTAYDSLEQTLSCLSNFSTRHISAESFSYPYILFSSPPSYPHHPQHLALTYLVSKLDFLPIQHSVVMEQVNSKMCQKSKCWSSLIPVTTFLLSVGPFLVLSATLSSLFWGGKYLKLVRKGYQRHD